MTNTMHTPDLHFLTQAAESFSDPQRWSVELDFNDNRNVIAVRIAPAPGVPVPGFVVTRVGAVFVVSTTMPDGGQQQIEVKGNVEAARAIKHVVAEFTGVAVSAPPLPATRTGTGRQRRGVRGLGEALR
jgi:hypothetical protein